MTVLAVVLTALGGVLIGVGLTSWLLARELNKFFAGQPTCSTCEPFVEALRKEK